jgi:ribosomal protein S18 acetylase RimI-like enzyme
LLADGLDREGVAATLEVRAGNDGALAFYRRFGFGQDGVRPGYYQDGADAVIMTLDRHHPVDPPTGAGADEHDADHRSQGEVRA